MSRKKINKPAAKKANKVSAKTASKASRQQVRGAVKNPLKTCTYSFPLTQEEFNDLIQRGLKVVVFLDESNDLEVKDLEEGNSKQMKEMKSWNVSERLRQKSSTTNKKGKDFQAFIRVGGKAYSGASQDTMKLAIAFIYWAIKVGASANYIFPGLSTHSNPFPSLPISKYSSGFCGKEGKGWNELRD